MEKCTQDDSIWAAFCLVLFLIYFLKQRQIAAFCLVLFLIYFLKQTEVNKVFPLNSKSFLSILDFNYITVLCSSMDLVWLVSERTTLTLEINQSFLA